MVPVMEHISLHLQDLVLRLSSYLTSFSTWLDLMLTSSFRYPSRNQLPATLSRWKHIQYEKGELYTHIWTSLEAFFGKYQFTYYDQSTDLNQYTPNLPAPGNYRYYSPSNPASAWYFTGFCVPTGCHHAARKNNRHYVIRVLSVGKEGLNQLKILRLLSNTTPDNLFSNYHILPMVEEMTFMDISFGAFPMLSGQLRSVLMPNWTKCTLEDALYLIMQALEGIIYLHGKNIAHRDLFTDNILVDFFPESLLEQQWVRPRAYISDFETAIHFPDDVKPSERLISGFPFPDFGLEKYSRKNPAPELLLPESHKYCPFRLDMYQFGCHLNQYLKTTGCEELDALWPPLMSENPADRPTARNLFEMLGNYLNKTPPKDLQRTWTYVHPEDDWI